MSRLISFAVLIAIIIVIGVLFYKVLVGFFIPVFLAAVLVVVFRPLHRWVLDRVGHREQLAAVVTTLLIVLALVLPFGAIFTSAAVQGLRLIEHNPAAVVQLRFNTMVVSLGLQMPSYIDELRGVDETITNIVQNTDDLKEEDPNLARMGARATVGIGGLQQALTNEIGDGQFTELWGESFDDLVQQAETIGIRDEEVSESPSRKAVRLKSDFAALKTDLLGGPIKALAREYANPTPERIEEITKSAVEYVRPRLLSITGATGAFIVRLIFGGVILIVATFFFLYDGPAMIQTIMRLSPLDDAYEQELLLEFDRISRAVVLATLLSAITQGLTAGLGYYFAGMDFLVLLVMLTTVFAMVPFVGPAVIWVPVCLYLGLYDGRMLAAGLLAVWGIAVVGTIDNVVKAFVLHGQSQLHPLLALLSVLGGVQTLGPVGIVVGPMVVAMLQTLLSILQRELLHFDTQQFVVGTEDAGTGTRMKSRKPLIPAEQRAPETSEDGGPATPPTTPPASEDTQPSPPATKTPKARSRRRSKRR